MTAKGRVTAQGLRAVLLDGPAGADQSGVALVDLLTEAGLLADPAFVDWCVYRDDDGYTDLDLALLSEASWPDALDLTGTQQRMVGAGVCLVDLAAELRELPSATGRRVLAALAGVVAEVEAGDAAARAYGGAADVHGRDACR